MKKIIWMAALSFFLVGCASTQKLTDVDRKGIKAVQVNPDMPKAAQFYYMGPGMAMAGGLLGPIGVFLSADDNKSEAVRIATAIDKSKLDVYKITYEELSAALEKSGKLPLAKESSPDATKLNIYVFQMGFSIPNGFSSKLVPLLGVRASLVDSSNRILWTDVERTMTLGNPSDGHTLDELLGDPNLLEQEMRLAAKDVAAGLVKDL